MFRIMKVAGLSYVTLEDGEGTAGYRYLKISSNRSISFIELNLWRTVNAVGACKILAAFNSSVGTQAVFSGNVNTDVSLQKIADNSIYLRCGLSTHYRLNVPIQYKDYITFERLESVDE